MNSHTHSDSTEEPASTNDTTYKVVVTHKKHGKLGTLDDTFDTEREAGHAAYNAKLSDVGIETDIVPVSDDNTKSATLWTDGASRGNPGPASGGIVLNFHDKNENLEESIRFGSELTNNQAEYSALQYGVEIAYKHNVDELSIRMDSELVVKQLTGEYSVSDETLSETYNVVTSYLSEMDWDVEHVPRENNARADELANSALDNAE